MLIAEFFVPGIPQPQGSKRGVVNKKTGKVMMLEGGDDAMQERHAHWRAAVSAAAHLVMRGGPDDGPLYISVKYFFPRPKYHFNSRGEVKRQYVDACMTRRPDRDKLDRAVGDALTGIVWRDDSQAVGSTSRKLYGKTPGVGIVVERACACGLALQLCMTHGPCRMASPRSPGEYEIREWQCFTHGRSVYQETQPASCGG